MSKSILEEAQELVYGDRAAQYGPWSKNANLAAEIAEKLVGRGLDARDITMVLISLKFAREFTNHKRDNLVDICGYLELYNQLCEGEND